MINTLDPLGIPLYQSDFYMPSYKEGIIGDWKISYTGTNLLRGYYSGGTMIQNMPVLLKKDSKDPELWNTWMSLTPVEMESQEFGIRAAEGHSVVMGLGMGWVAINMALKREVKSVTVIELDPDVIELFYKSGALDSLIPEVQNKIKIINTNAMEWIPETTINFLYTDIWLKFAEPQTIRQVKEMQHNIQAEKIYIWGQEIFIYNALKQEGRLDLLDDTKGIQEFSYGMFSLPIAVPEDIDYGQIIRQVMENRNFPGLKP